MICQSFLREQSAMTIVMGCVPLSSPTNAGVFDLYDNRNKVCAEAALAHQYKPLEKLRLIWGNRVKEDVEKVRLGMD